MIHTKPIATAKRKVFETLRFAVTIGLIIKFSHNAHCFKLSNSMKIILKIFKFVGLGILLMAILIIGYTYSLTFTPYGRMDWRQAAIAKYVSFNPLTKEQYAKMSLEDFRKMMPQEPLQPVGSIDSLKITSDCLPLYIYKPVGLLPNAPVVIYYHGGGFYIPFSRVSNATARKYANAFKAIVVAVDYRTAPKFPFPIPVNDAYNTFKWVVENAKNFGGNPEKIATIGESAGGNLATVIAQKAKNEGFTNIKYQILFCPTTDAAHFYTYPSAKKIEDGYLLDKDGIDFTFKSYIPNKTMAFNPEVSPLLSKDLSGLPPAFVITAEFDPLHDEGFAYFKKLEKAGVSSKYKDMKGCIHVVAGPFMGDVINELNNEMAVELKKAFK